MKNLFTLLYLVALCFHTFALAQIELVKIPMTDKGFFSSKEIHLEAILYKPPGVGSFPVVVFNHGSTGNGTDLIRRKHTETMPFFARYLNEKGIGLIIPMRRGRGNSEGDYNEYYSCDRASAGVDYAAASLDATLNFLTGVSWVDNNRLIIAGQSRGGILSTIYASRNPEKFKGVINIVGGWMSDSCGDRGNTGDVNLYFFKRSGQLTKTPHLFLYAENDSFYKNETTPKYSAVFQEGGGNVVSKMYQTPTGQNGHFVFYNSFDLVRPDLDAFLKSLDLN